MTEKEQYTQLAKMQYIQLLLRLIKQDTNLDAVSLLQARMNDTGMITALRDEQNKLKINYETTKEYEIKVCRDLIAYYQEVKFIHSFQLPNIAESILEDKRNTLKLPTTVKIIEDILLGLEPYSAKLKKYDLALKEAISRDGVPLCSSTTWELQRLQFLLGIKHQDIVLPAAVRSEFGIDYIPLWRYLKSQQWQEANQETQRIMVEIARRNRPQWRSKRQKGSQGAQMQDAQPLNATEWIQVEDLQNFPCLDLLTIDHLWLNFSQGYYGFSVQRQLWWWQENDWEQFTQQVGWLANGELVAETQLRRLPKPERGQLPYLVQMFKLYPTQRWEPLLSECMLALFLKLETCPIRMAA